ncbi:MAG: FAD binding domain-containing protein [Halanaerobiales bacterium]
MKNRVYQPQSLEEALEIIKENDQIKILAGGTDLLLELDRLKKDKVKLMDVSGIDSLQYIKRDEEMIKIGALTTFAEINKNKVINSYLSSLADAARSVGSVQIRNRATIGGNIANTSPAADSLPVLSSLSARIKIESLDDKRVVAVSDIINGFYQNNLDSAEMITEINIPVPDNSHFLYFDKVGSRKSVTIARLNLGAKLEIEDTVIKDAVIYFGALSEKPCRAESIENYLTGKKIGEINKSDYNQLLKKVVDQAIPGRYSQQYKRNAICGLGDNLREKLKLSVDKGE